MDNTETDREAIVNLTKDAASLERMATELREQIKRRDFTSARERLEYMRETFIVEMLREIARGKLIA